MQLASGYAPAEDLPVELQRNLHPALCIRLIPPETEIRVLERSGVTQRPELRPIQQIECLPAEVQPLLFAVQVDASSQREVLVVAREIAQLGVVPRLVAER